MASLNEIAHSFADSVDKGHDVAYIRRIKFSIRYWRAKLIRQEAERTPLNAHIEQSFIDQLTDVDELDDCVISSGCTVKRTLNKVPAPVHIKGSDPFNYVGPVSIKCPEDVAFTYSTPTAIANASYKRFTANIIRYIYRNGYVYVYGECLRKYIRITHPFENPTDAAQKCNTAAACFTDDDEYPIGAHMLDTILKGLQSGEMRVMTDDREVHIEEK